VDAVKKAGEAKKQAVGSLFGDDEEMLSIEVQIKELPEYEQMEILEFEKESLGFYVSGHPLDKYRETIDEINYTLSSEIDTLADGSEAIIVGRVEGLTNKISKKGKPFGIANVLDFHGNLEFMLFEDQLRELEEDFDLSKPIAFKVRARVNDFGVSLSVRKIESLKEAKSEKLKTKKAVVVEPPLHVNIPLADDENILYKLFEVVAQNQGKRDMTITIKSKLGDVEIDSGYKINKNAEALIKEIAGVYCD
jgi:DNA polymerase-3 subunit alpha